MATDETTGAIVAPVKSAKVAEWRTYAMAHGMSEDDAAAATKDQLIAQYGDPDADETPARRRTGSVEVYAPNREFAGEVAGVAFANGKATAKWEDDAGAIAYMRRQGYGIGEKPAAEPRRAPEPAVTAIEAAAMATVGGRLRDAAVDPHPDDFLPPVNAGKYDPHGPNVVSPEIHHTGPAGLRPGPVAVDEPKRQSREESEVAEAILIDGQDVGEALGTFAPGDDQGDLGLSDPGSAEAGRVEAERAVEAGEVQTKEQLREAAAASEGTPTKSARVGAWRDYAIAQGMDPDEAAAATKGELVEQYGGEG